MTWLAQHLAALRSACGQIRGTPGSFLFNMLVVAIALTLPFAGLTAIDNLRPVSMQLAVKPEISVFMNPSTTRERALALESEIQLAARALDASASVGFLPRERALATLKERTGLSEALGMLDVNPLPDAYVVTLSPVDNASEAMEAERLAQQFTQLEGVDSAQVDGAWVKRMAALLHVARLVLVILAATLALVAIAVIFNTIRLQVLTQREEIGIAKLVGATNSFIRRPFLYAGVLIGLGAGAFAIAAVVALIQPLNTAIAEFARLYASEFRLALPAWPILSTLLLISTALGWLGAALSTRRHLDSSHL